MTKFIENLFMVLFLLIVATIFCGSCYILYHGLTCDGASRGVIMGSFLFTGIILALSCMTLIHRR